MHYSRSLKFGGPGAHPGRTERYAPTIPGSIPEPPGCSTATPDLSKPAPVAGGSNRLLITVVGQASGCACHTALHAPAHHRHRDAATAVVQFRESHVAVVPKAPSPTGDARSTATPRTTAGRAHTAPQTPLLTTFDAPPPNVTALGRPACAPDPPCGWGR